MYNIKMATDSNLLLYVNFYAPVKDGITLGVTGKFK